MLIGTSYLFIYTFLGNDQTTYWLVMDLRNRTEPSFMKVEL